MKLIHQETNFREKDIRFVANEHELDVLENKNNIFIYIHDETGEYGFEFRQDMYHKKLYHVKHDSFSFDHGSMKCSIDNMYTISENLSTLTKFYNDLLFIDSYRLNTIDEEFEYESDETNI